MHVVDVESPELVGYVISISKRHGRRCLHYVGRCPRVPYVHYKEAEEMGMELPPPHTYNAVCGDCWAKEEKTAFGDAQNVCTEIDMDAVLSAAESSSDDDDDLTLPL